MTIILLEKNGKKGFLLAWIISDLLRNSFAPFPVKHNMRNYGIIEPTFLGSFVVS
jgi:hypothetical protein